MYLLFLKRSRFFGETLFTSLKKICKKKILHIFLKSEYIVGIFSRTQATPTGNKINNTFANF